MFSFGVEASKEGRVVADATVLGQKGVRLPTYVDIGQLGRPRLCSGKAWLLAPLHIAVGRRGGGAVQRLALHQIFSSHLSHTRCCRSRHLSSPAHSCPSLCGNVCKWLQAEPGGGAQGEGRGGMTVCLAISQVAQGCVVAGAAKETNAERRVASCAGFAGFDTREALGKCMAARGQWWGECV